jgi:hypothetical protein
VVDLMEALKKSLGTASTSGRAAPAPAKPKAANRNRPSGGRRRVGMNTQLPLPARWAIVETRSEPRDPLKTLQRDMAIAKARIREALDELAERHGIPASHISYAMEGYADDLLSDAVYNVERELEREIEDQDPV